MSFIRELQKRFTRSKQWPKVRNSFLKKNPKCSCCGSTKSLEVHHRIPFHERPELELDENNLIVLCDGTLRCHLFVGHLGSYKSFNKEVWEDSVKWNFKIEHRP